MANDRLSQIPVEVALQPDSAKARTSQEPVEVAVQPTNAKARVSQGPVEVAVQPTSAKARSSQVAVEVLIRNYQQVDVGFISNPATAFAPTVDQGQQVAIGLINQTAVAFAPRLRYDQSVSLGLISNPTTAFAPSLAKLEIFLGRINRTAVAYEPFINTGEIVFPFVFDQTAIAFAPTVSTPALQTVTFGLINNLARANAIRVTTPGVVTDSFVELLYDGVDIIDDVIISDAQFTTQVNGVPGSCRVRVKDTPRTRSFVAGKSLLLRINGENAWRGFVAMIRRGFAFDAEDRTGDKPRFFVLDGFDVNIMFRKRVVFNVNDPVDLTGPVYTADNTPDTTAFADLFADYLDLGGDGLDTTTLVEHVGSVNIDQNAAPIQPSGTWEGTMRNITALTNSIWYIDPDLNVVHTDVDTPNAPFDLSDQPVGDVGYREMELTTDGTGLINDALVWGMGVGGTQAVIARDEDATSIALHGRWQYGEINGFMYKQATVNRRAASIVDGSPLSKRGAKNDRIALACTIFENGYRVAQKVRFTSEVFDFTDVMPIRRMDITFVSPTAPRYRLFISHEIDLPWGFFDKYFYDFDFGIPEIDVFPPELPELTPCDETDAGPIYGEPQYVAIPNCGGATANDLHAGPSPAGPPSWGNGTSYPIGVELYHGATYQVTYNAIHAGPSEGLRDTPIGVVLIDASGAFRLATMNMGSNYDGTAITTATFDFVGYGDGAPGTSRCFYLYMFDWNYPNDHVGSSVSAHITFVSGPDPRFDNQEFVIGRGGGIRPCEGGEAVITLGGGGRWDFDGDGTTTVYTLPSAYVPGSTRVYVNGIFQRPGHEYTESDPQAGEITFLYTPATQDEIAIFFEVSKL